MNQPEATAPETEEQKEITHNRNWLRKMSIGIVAGAIAISSCVASASGAEKHEVLEAIETTTTLPDTFESEIVAPVDNVINAPETDTEEKLAEQVKEKFDPNKAMVAALVVSMGKPPESEVEAYKEFGANTIFLWEAEEAGYWGDIPAVVWTDVNGNQVNDPVTRTPEPLKIADNVVAIQMGDEPSSPDKLSDLSLLNTEDSIGKGTNFSYWAPLAEGEADMESNLDVILEGYEGEWISNSDYHLGPVRYVLLNYFLEKAKEKNIPAWQYVNAYSGYETDMQKIHTESDMAWQGFTGIAMGYRGTVYFMYQINPNGHQEATQGGGSVFFENPGEWGEKTQLWYDVANINRGLLRLGDMTEDLSHEATCLLPAEHTQWQLDTVNFRECEGIESTGEVLVGEFNDGWKLIVNANHTHSNKDFSGSDESSEITVDVAEGHKLIVFDAEGGIQETDGTFNLQAGWGVLVHEDNANGLLIGDTHWYPEIQAL